MSADLFNEASVSPLEAIEKPIHCEVSVLSMRAFPELGFHAGVARGPRVLMRMGRWTVGSHTPHLVPKFCTNMLKI